MKTVSIIPIKLNNERLPGKNTKLLGGKPLISYIIESVEASKEIDERYVYCSSEKICEYLNGTVKFLKRPDFLDLPSSNFTQIFGCFCDEVDADIYVYAHATAPFVSVNSIDECIKAVKSGEYDSAFTATMIQDFLWQNGKPLNFDAANVPRSQDIEPIYRESSGIYVFTREVFKKLSRRVGIKPYIKVLSFKEAVDINTPEDFQLARYFVDDN